MILSSTHGELIPAKMFPGNPGLFSWMFLKISSDLYYKINWHAFPSRRHLTWCCATSQILRIQDRKMDRFGQIWGWLSLFSSPWWEAFIARFAAIFLLSLHNSESNRRGCSRRCRNMKSQIPAPCWDSDTAAGTGAVWTASEQSQTWNHDHLARGDAGPLSPVIPSRR